MSAPVVLLDACTLVPIRLTSCLLSLAEAGLIAPLWSDEILDEVERNLPKLKGMTHERATQRVAAMREAFDDEASVDGYQELIPRLSCDPKDRHVLAAAVHGGADVLLTFNVKDFPPESTESFALSVEHPDSFLASLLVEQRDRVLEVLREDALRNRRPPTTVAEYFAGLAATVPTFATLANDAASLGDEDESPVPALVAADEDDALAAYGVPGDITNPAQVTLLWWLALLERDPAVHHLTYDPSAWGDYEWAREHLEGRAPASRVIPLVDAPEQVAVMRFVPEPSAVAQAFAAFRTSVTFLTLVRVPDGTWRVWGLGPGILSAREILD
ncbi:PIN domain-containing protein [Aestuariimicrobium ganziense]|uniref:PIN domain-containing protein n=1 Tax=Aestuariimicrobium ganziense TaxID=2773677 RepID=UPI00194346ED|nr:PIN domain-containing protein [Aestuariimicrobium ganziense]